MTTEKIVGAVKDVVAGAKSKAEMVGAHGKDVLKAGTQTVQAAKEVVAKGGRDTVEVLSHTRDELKRTLKEGVAQVGDRLSRIATPNRKEEALARKAEVKAKKRRKLVEQHEGATPSEG